MRSGAASKGGLGVAWLLAVGCASIPKAPAPLILDVTPDVPELAPFHDLVIPMPRGLSDAPPALPLFPLTIHWAPERPLQASVIAIRVPQPPGPALEDVSARLAGREVRMRRSAEGWAGVGGLPVDSSGIFELEVRATRNGIEEVARRLVRVEDRTYPSTRIRISADGASDPQVDARIARERELIQSRLRSSGPTWFPAGPFDWPRPPVRTSPFGQRRVFNGSVRSRHMGLDLRGRRGNPVYAPAAGRVLLTGRFFYQGNAVYLDHGLGLVTAYFHFSEIAVERGDFVEPGQLIGRVGSTGRSTAPHLHWSAYVDGHSVDPESLVGFVLTPEAASEDQDDNESRGDSYDDG